ncbi:MAG: hypothetical protein V4451_17400 [Pseudomonadota bacterium]
MAQHRLVAHQFMCIHHHLLMETQAVAENPEGGAPDVDRSLTFLRPNKASIAAFFPIFLTRAIASIFLSHGWVLPYSHK